ncbi:MAG: sn-glycerol-3-phosphate ABC transporter ATP-binding protein UgpC [Acidimicrobiaceae bacterium]|nr:sn-glycerol-3-phosphate ABC transporter ATP-binding protein UgpC [Acidimicrobiaceae bacterium]MDE0494185.1 sn-glycerol-3-phosphate ABC transporter ATP-binding protein UgpC [Acidimicrobiaceae bacterium]MDE0655515.1 sn-glycerol-3-phosphate ABC transporter ATP-binding protein UgpC [Acidimicrobiaceae bacterium]MDE0664239.1 sn-glycerol-3-phosphate ABC transporter ATP-binding protein UgpC [Acidimicrobiaceae bacterium]MXY10121.1 sn-glycerol-3-phosphate ABC transporter ATP-binding protein UgpC [Acid
MATVELEELTKIYPGGVKAVDAMSLSIDDGEFVVFVGPSGCGKSTALRMVAGLEEISEGVLRIGGNEMTKVHPRQRDIAMVFQNYALYPHLTVRKNIAYPLKLAKVPKVEMQERVQRTAEVLQLSEYLDRKPGALSGGQRQRVAMGRAIVREPSVFLMDEPLSNLDAKLRVYMRSEISRIQRELGVTTIYVTHDQVEAMTMGDRVAVLKGGVLQQADKPSVLYSEPANLFVAGFIGSPAMNLFESSIQVEEQSIRVRVGQQSVDLPLEYLDQFPALRSYDGERLVCGIRPDDVYDAALNPGLVQRLQGDVALLEKLGSEIVAHLDVGVRRFESAGADETEDELGTGFIGRFRPQSEARAGDRMEVALDVSAMHFFDLATGEAIRS